MRVISTRSGGLQLSLAPLHHGSLYCAFGLPARVPLPSLLAKIAALQRSLLAKILGRLQRFSPSPPDTHTRNPLSKSSGAPPMPAASQIRKRRLDLQGRRCPDALQHLACAPGEMARAGALLRQGPAQSNPDRAAAFCRLAKHAEEPAPPPRHAFPRISCTSPPPLRTHLPALPLQSGRKAPERRAPLVKRGASGRGSRAKAGRAAARAGGSSPLRRRTCSRWAMPSSCRPRHYGAGLAPARLGGGA